MRWIFYQVKIKSQLLINLLYNIIPHLVTVLFSLETYWWSFCYYQFFPNLECLLKITVLKVTIISIIVVYVSTSSYPVNNTTKRSSVFPEIRNFSWIIQELPDKVSLYEKTEYILYSCVYIVLERIRSAVS